MTVKIQILSGMILVVGLVLLLNMVRKRALELKYVLTWIISCLTLLFFVLFPRAMDQLAAFMGIYSPVNMIFFLGFVLSIAIIFSLTVALSRLTARVRMLAQTIALQEQKEREDREKLLIRVGLNQKTGESHEESMDEYSGI